MPFGLDIKSVIVGVVLALFVYPWVMGMINSRTSATTSAP
jgi:hypothetical protein